MRPENREGFQAEKKRELQADRRLQEERCRCHAALRCVPWPCDAGSTACDVAAYVIRHLLNEETTR